MRGPEENERLLSEMQAGIYTHDMVHVGVDLIPRFQSLGFFVDPIDWNGLFKIDPRMIHPRRFGVAVANTLGGIMYNKNKVPKVEHPEDLGRLHQSIFPRENGNRSAAPTIYRTGGCSGRRMGG